MHQEIKCALRFLYSNVTHDVRTYFLAGRCLAKDGDEIAKYFDTRNVHVTDL